MSCAGAGRASCGMPRKQPLESMSKQEMYGCQADPGSGRAVIRPLTAIFSFLKIGPRCCMCRQSNLSAGLLLRSVDIIKRLPNDGRSRVVW
jgi:hypothetical protein